LPQITFHKDPSVQTTKNKVERRCAAQKQINTKGYALCAADAIFVEVDPKDQELGALRAQFIIAMSARLGADRFPGPDASNDAAELLINIGNAEDSIGSLLLASANSTDYMAPVNRAQVITTTIYVAWSAIKPVLKQDKDTLLTLPPTERLTQSREILAHLAAENIHLDCYKEALFLAKNQSSERDTGGNHWQWMKQDFMRKCDRVAQLSKLENEDSYCKKFPCKYLHEAGVVYE
jgi:hypothetical protein